KRSIVLDFKKPAALDAVHRLIAGADVFVSNVRPEGLARASVPATPDRLCTIGSYAGRL
ncbi:MAG: CoA transferase, partial [Rhodospirillales bacterium]|nr:CoA transferase [Rhodospirillales bacterium]